MATRRGLSDLTLIIDPTYIVQRYHASCRRDEENASNPTESSKPVNTPTSAIIGSYAARNIKVTRFTIQVVPSAICPIIQSHHTVSSPITSTVLRMAESIPSHILRMRLLATLSLPATRSTSPSMAPSMSLC